MRGAMVKPVREGGLVFSVLPDTLVVWSTGAVVVVVVVVVVVDVADSFSDVFDEPSDDVESRGVRESDLTEAVICAGPNRRIGWSTSNFGSSTKRRRIMRSLASSLLPDSSNRTCSALLVIATLRSSSMICSIDTMIGCVWRSSSSFFGEFIYSIF